MKSKHDKSSGAGKPRQRAGEPLEARCSELETRNAGLERTCAELETRLAHYTDLYDRAPVGYLTLDRSGIILEANQRGAELLGKPQAKLSGNAFSEFICDRSRSDLTRLLAAAFANDARSGSELAILDARGQVLTVHVEAAVDASRQSCRLAMLNINERKQTEGALRHSQEMLRALISHQERVREEERKRIAREIHDELGQNLFALRLDIEALHERTRHTHPKINERTGEALAHIDATMKAARLAINNLRPSVLDLGLTAAVEWQVRDFRRTSGIVAELEMDDLDDTLDEDRATALFRILQEALAYVARHSQSSGVRVELRRDGDMLLMEVGNQGSGIFPGCRRKANTFGLAGIAARAYALGGEMKVEVSEGKGTRTRLTVSIPLKESASWPAQPGAKVMQAQILYSHAIDTARPTFCSASRA